MRALACIALAVAAAFALAAAPRADEPSDGGTKIRVEVADGGDTTLEVARGQLKVRAGGDESRLSAGEGAHVKRGEKPKRISILPAPTGLAPGDGAHLNTTDVALEWEPVDGASSYHVTVAADERFVKVVHDAARAEEPRSRARVKDAGTYYWRVSCNRGDLEGRPSAPRKFVVDTTPPKLKTGKPKWR
jgi:hypothetical protein